MMSHIESQPAQEVKKDSWQSKAYKVDQRRRLVAARKAKEAEQQKKKEEKAAKVLPPVKPIYDNGDGDDDVMIRKFKSKAKFSNKLKNLHTSDMLNNLLHFDQKI